MRGFKFDKDKLPFYDIPNLDGFELKPYVEYLAPLLTEDLKDYQKVVNENKLKQMSSTSQSS